MAAGLVTVHHVVVQQREIVHQLDGDRGGDRVRRVAARRLRAKQHQRGPQRLAATRPHRLTAGVPPAEVIAGDLPHGLGQPVRRGLQGRVEQAFAPREHIGGRAGRSVHSGHARPISTPSSTPNASGTSTATEWYPLTR